LSLAEVCKVKDVKEADPQTLADFFENEYLLLVNVDREVGTLARKLMMSGLSGLKPADACHLATAALTPGVSALHTFDDKLLKLTNQVTKVDSLPLKICFPDVGGPTPPLLAGV
jgi:predicted nucleic acid-binding protein